MGPGVCVQEGFPHTEVRSIAMLMVCCARVIVAVVGLDRSKEGIR